MVIKETRKKKTKFQSELCIFKNEPDYCMCGTSLNEAQRITQCYHNIGCAGKFCKNQFPQRLKVTGIET